MFICMPMCMLFSCLRHDYMVVYTSGCLYICVFLVMPQFQLYMHEYMCKSIDKLMYLAAMTIIHT